MIRYNKPALLLEVCFLFRGYNLRQRIVIDIDTAERIGSVSDVEIDEATGHISSIIVKRRFGYFSGFLGFGELTVPWSAIMAVGREFVLVKSFDFGEKCLKN